MPAEEATDPGVVTARLLYDEIKEGRKETRGGLEKLDKRVGKVEEKVTGHLAFHNGKGAAGERYSRMVGMIVKLILAAIILGGAVWGAAEIMRPDPVVQAKAVVEALRENP